MTVKSIHRQGETMNIFRRLLAKKTEEPCSSYTLPIIEDGEVTGCIYCGRSDEEQPEMTYDEFMKLLGEQDEEQR